MGIVLIFLIAHDQSNNAKKTPAKRTRKVKQIKILDEEDERELEAAGQSILTNMVEQEVITVQKNAQCF